MRKLLIRFGSIALGLLTAVSISSAAETILGAGATFPYPIYAKWANAYKQETGVVVNYQSIGSGGGIKQIKAKTVTFGASDMPLKPDDLIKSGLVQFPMIMGGVVPVVNLPDLKQGQLVLTGKDLALIYSGKVTYWDDPQFSFASGGLPHLAINVVHRSDGSGTTFLFTDYMTKVDAADWSVGEGTSVEWPTGIGAKGNEGVAAQVKQLPGSIGYVEYAYAVQNKMIFADMVNHDGKTVEPGVDSFQAAAANANWDVPGMAVVLTDQSGAKSWPITGVSYILMHEKADNVDEAKAAFTALKFFSWAYTHGQLALDLDYVPIMVDVWTKVANTVWTKIESGR